MLWRHGQTQWNDSRRFQGQTDVALDDVGRAQASLAAEQLAGLSPQLIVTSDLVRAAETADSLALRIATARKELKRVESFDYLIVNREYHLDETVDTIRAIIDAEHHRVKPRKVEL